MIYNNIYLFQLNVGKFTCTQFQFAATTAQTTMNKAIQSMSASVQVNMTLNYSKDCPAG
ncbi:hypothetical protein HMPREF2531_03963 [Bacteroides intestinalis]|uniref:Uncharacterized protein n=1 Tax=Bacteroides intestinalis TaxID=329854 RepID=A0A139KYL0_9BACE|nr:hypothetical protein HMPREF2531_03963 [Bacteroides intestinalis]